jgi:hypothetical protein
VVCSTSGPGSHTPPQPAGAMFAVFSDVCYAVAGVGVVVNHGRLSDWTYSSMNCCAFTVLTRPAGETFRMRLSVPLVT